MRGGGLREREPKPRTISPIKTTFSPRMRNRPCQLSAKALPWYIRSTVSSSTRLATAKRNLSVTANRGGEVAHRIGRKNAEHRAVSCHRVGLLASFLGKCSMPGEEVAAEKESESRGRWLRTEGEKHDDFGQTYCPHNPPGSPTL